MPLSAFYTALRSRREEFGLSVETAAKAVGVAADTWLAYEAGKRTPPLGRLPAIVKLLGPAPLNALLEGSGHICQRPHKRDVLMERWVELAEAFLVEVRKAQSEE